MTEWGICTTLKASQDQVLAFVAHHLCLGAAHIWLHFDDPTDGVAACVAGLPNVTAIACDDAYWDALIGRRPPKHQNRQGRNMQRIYKAEPLPWIAHIDVDEYILPDRDIGAALGAVPADQPMLRMPPWEALHDPSLPDDIFTARHFRAALRGKDNAAARTRVFGPFAPLMEAGVLSHAAGKCFFRTGLARFEPRLHGAFRAGTRVPGGDFCDDIALLHFHAEDPARWKDRLQFRLTKGAYQFNEALQSWLLAASPDQIDAFYLATQTATPDTLQKLRAENILLESDLTLRQKIADLKH